MGGYQAGEEERSEHCFRAMQEVSTAGLADVRVRIEPEGGGRDGKSDGILCSYAAQQLIHLHTCHLWSSPGGKGLQRESIFAEHLQCMGLWYPGASTCVFFQPLVVQVGTLCPALAHLSSRNKEPSVCRLAALLCLTLCNLKDCSPPDSSASGILQARILEWVAISSSRGIFLIQGSNPGLLLWQVGSLPSEPPGNNPVLHFLK